MSSMSPTKDAKLIKTKLETIQREDLPSGLLAYSLCKKQARTFAMNNARLLILSQADRSIGYSNDPPKELPVGDVSKIPQKHKASLVSCQPKIYSDNKCQLILNVELLEPQKNKKDKWVMIFAKPEQAKDWETIIRNTKDKIRDIELLSSKKPIPQSGMIQSEKIVLPISATIVRNNQSNEPLPIDSYIREVYQMGPDQPIIQNRANNSRVDLFNSLNPQLQREQSSKPRVVESVYGNDSEKKSQLAWEGGHAAVVSVIKEQPSIRGSKGIPKDIPQPPSSNIGNNGGIGDIGTIQNSPSTRSIVAPPLIPKPSQSSQNEQPKPGASSIFPAPSNLSSKSVILPAPAPRGNVNNWNQQFVTSQDPIHVILQFQKAAQDSVVQIVDELVLQKSIRKFLPTEYQSGRQLYETDSLQIVLALIDESGDSRRSVKNEWRNYHYILTATKNKGLLKVPVACLVQYKGITALVKGKVINASVVEPSSINTELSELQRFTRISKEAFYKDERVQLLRTRLDGNKQVIFINNLQHYIPIDVYSEREASQLRSQTIQTLQRAIPSGPTNFAGSRKLDRSQLNSMQGLQQAAQTMRAFSEQVLDLFESFQIILLNNKELAVNMHLNGVNMRCLGEMHKRARTPLIKKYLVSEMAARVFGNILRNQLQVSLLNFSIDQTSKNNSHQSEVILMDMCFSLLNNVLSVNPQSDRLWKAIASQVKNKYQVSFAKEDLAVGYFLSSLLDKANLQYNYQLLLKDKQYLKTANILKRDFVRGFGVKSKSYSISFTEIIGILESILNEKPSREGCESLIRLLRLESNPIPAFCQTFGYDLRIRLYLSHFINCQGQKLEDITHSNPPRAVSYRHLQLYKSITYEPPTYRTIRLALKAIQWELNLAQFDNADKLYEITEDKITFWGGDGHPLLSELYDVFAAHNSKVGNYEQAMVFAKGSIQNVVKIAGSNSMLTAQKYYDFGSLCYKAGKKDDALAHFIKTREINQAHNATNSREYASLCLKMALLYLNLNQNSESLARALQCLKVADKLDHNENELINIYELLFRSYEITDQNIEMANLATTCAKRLKECSDSRIVSRMMKLAIHPTIKPLKVNTKKQLIDLAQELKLKRQSRLDEWKQRAFQTYFMNNEEGNFALDFVQKLQKVDRYLNEIITKKLISGYTGPQPRSNSEAEEFLQEYDITCCLTGDSFMLGFLREE